MITQIQFPLQALIHTGLSALNIILLVLAGIALMALVYFAIKEYSKENKQEQVQ